MEKATKLLLCLTMAMVMALSFAAYAETENGIDENTLAEMKMAESGALYSDIIAGIDHDSIIVDGDTTFFSSIMSDGTAVRFEGENIYIDADGITMPPESTIISLDSVGKIYLYRASIKDGTEAPVSEQWLDIGYGYMNSADKISVERASSIYADPLMGYPVAAWNSDVSLSIANFEPNFVFVKSASGNTMEITVTSLTIGHNPAEKFTDIEVAKKALPDYFNNFDTFFETADVVYEEVYEETYQYDDSLETEEKFSENDLSDPGMISSDIIAGVDYDSIIVDGDATFFSSIMSDGTVVRFEGKNIAIDEDGIIINPESSITSLDAIGKIYTYQVTVKDGEKAPISDQWLMVGYGYTFDAEKTSVERADEVCRESQTGYPASVWNLSDGISVADYAPNFLFVDGFFSTNTTNFTLTSLVISYQPSEKYTDLSELKENLPDFIYNALEAAANAMENDVEEIDEVEYEEEVIINENTLAEMKMEEPGAIYSDVIAGIDYTSVRVEGNATFFSSVMSDGAVVRFEGKNITVDENGITLNPESRITSLDAVGKIYLYRATVKDGTDASIRDQWIGVGGGYTFVPEKTSVERSSDLYANGTAVYPASDWNGNAMISMVNYEPNFVFFDASNSNSTAITLTSLTIGYNPDEKYTAIEDVQGYLPDYYYTQTNTAIITADVELATSNDINDSQNTIPPEMDYEGEIDDDVFAEIKMAEAGALSSDIIAGIDHDSVRVEGDATFFSSIMKDGTIVRFEGKNISINEEGITMNPAGRVTSLDAVGKIYRYSADVKDKDKAPVSEQMMNIGYGYTFSASKTSVERADEVFTYSITGWYTSLWSPDSCVSVAFYEPNFVFFNSQDYNTESFMLTSLIIDYIPDEKVTAITEAKLSAYYYGYYMEGEPYNAAKEDKADAAKREYDFYLVLKQETLDKAGVENDDRWLHFLPNTFYEVGDLKDADGNVQDKETARIQEGYTLDVTVGDYTLTLDMPMADLYEGAQTLKDARPYSTLTAVGKQNTLVIPVVWADQTALVSDDLYALFQKELGKLIDEQGNTIGDFSDANDEVFSLTEYFNTASYGQLEISSFMTDWYYADKTFAEDYEYIFPEIDFADEVLRWVKETYPDTDWTQFDQDGDGVVDSIVLLSVGATQFEGYTPSSFGGAVHSTGSNYGKFAGTQEDPQANCFLTVNYAFLKDGDTNTLIHEYSHNFGLNDYYDGSGYGINAVGGYDMEGDSVGDWNAYSKLAVGWMDPQIVTDLVDGESVELTIRSSALAGDVIILPAAGTEYEGPFGEYVMIDLLSPDGVNTYDAAKYDLQDVVGIRISHVNANLKRSTESDGVIGYIEDNGNVIGMELYSNNYKVDGLGFYNIEVIQSGRENTFTNLEKLYPYLSAEDLFYEGDTFAAEEYDQFFYQGLMDNGKSLGYAVTILSIDTDTEGNPTATICITVK